MSPDRAGSSTIDDESRAIDQKAGLFEYDVSEWVTECPTCGTFIPKHLETCSECGNTVCPESKTNDTIRCPMCDGTGTVYLNYIDDYGAEDDNQDEKYLPCADCDGTGKIPELEIIRRQNWADAKHIFRFLFALSRKLGR